MRTERQARYRQRPSQAQKQGPVEARPRGPTLSRRWNDTVAGLLALRDEYARWLEALPEATRDTATGEALRAMVDLDLEEIMAISRRAASDAIKSGDVTISHHTSTAPHDALPARRRTRTKRTDHELHKPDTLTRLATVAICSAAAAGTGLHQSVRHQDRKCHVMEQLPTDATEQSLAQL